MSGEDRFWSKVDAGGDCWEWTAGRDRCGYGGYSVAGVWRGAHRVAYELLVGPVPAELELDHLCRNRGCVNPDHLEPISHADNVRRGSGQHINGAKTHCVRGHPFDEANTRLEAGRHHRTCRACERDKSRARRAAA